MHFHPPEIREQRKTTWTITARSRVAFREEVLQHLGLRPGEKIGLERLPDGLGTLKAAPQREKIGDSIGFPAGRTTHLATLKGIKATAEAGGSGNR